jgi:hypothetical protein
MIRQQLNIIFLVLISHLFTSVVEAQVRCPTIVRILPCQCTEDPFGGGGTTQLRCYRLNVEDETISGVLDVYLTTPLLSPLSRLDAFRKRLTKVPDQLPRFPRLNSVQLHRNNIHHIPSGAFNFNSDLFILNLSFNELTTIESGAFQGDETKLIALNSKLKIQRKSFDRKLSPQRFCHLAVQQ